MPLKLAPIFYAIVFLLFSLPPSTGLIAKLGCQDRCGSLSIPYPFGVGSDCSRDSFFTINCNSSTDPPKPYLAIIEAEVVEINQTYVRVKYPNLVSTCYDLSVDNRGTTVAAKSFHEPRTLNLSGTPYTLSSNNMLTAIGCDDVMLQSNGSLARGGGGGCSAFCMDKNDTGVGYCPSAGSSLGNGCCQVGMYPGFTGHTFIGAQLFDSSGTLGRRRLRSCSYAFVHENTNPNETVFSYPLYYLNNYTALLDDNWASAARMPVLRLDWFFKADNCSQAKLNAATYACLDDKSVCVSHVNFVSGHYLCSCVAGYKGNPYLPGGCQRISVSSSIAKLGCLDQCGNLSIPFPFGVGPNCSLGPSFEISCNTSTNPPEGYLTVLNKKISELNSTTVLVEYPNVGSSCFDLSNSSEVTDRRLIFDLSETQYTLSDENWITAIGNNDMVMVVTGKNGWGSTSMRSSCAAISSDIMETNDMAPCPSGSTTYSSGDGCCRASIPTGSGYLEAYLKNLRGEWTSTNISCSYAFIQYNRKDDSYGVAYTKMDDSTLIEPIIHGGPKTVALDWRIGDVNCKQARRDPANFMCQVSSECIDFDATVGGYLCNCSQGYQGNPYLTTGCQDIDECADDKTNTCYSTSSCVNTPGSYNCVCPEGHFGDGRKYGAGCIKLPPSKSKMMILIGLGSGSGFLLLFSMCFWLYAALQRRKLKIVKEKFFKRNGGLLLQQQTNEGVLGKIKVFTSNELDVATDHFNDNRILGQGGQGTVYKGMLSDGKIVAVKKSKLVEENQLDQFINEVAILSQINHTNVVKLLGCCLETEVPLLVYEFMPNGTLFDLIHDQNNEFPFTWNIRLKIATDIAGALSYLHYASSVPIYHRDIKSSNILLDEKYVVKVSDFGTSRTVSVDQTHLTTLVKGTFGYLDPEYFQSSQFTEKSDVYSFGVVLVELLTGQRAISLERTDSDRSLATRFLTCMEGNCLDRILDPEIWEDDKTEGVISVARLAQRCLNLQGKMRPTMKEVAIELESLKTPSNVVKDNELKKVNIFKGKPLMTSDAEYTWTSSSKSDPRLSSDSHPLVFGTK